MYSGTVERFQNAYREIARKLKIPGCQSPESDILRLVKDWFEDDRSGQWLMILDNADDAEIMYGSESLRLADYLPKSDQGSILLTTRFHKVGASFASTRNVIRLQQMNLAESELLLRARLGDEIPGQNPSMYTEVAEELERTPLALVQAASFMSQNCVPLESYLQMYRESDVAKIELLSENFEDDTRDAENKNPIAATWIISFDYIRMHVPQAAELLSLMSIIDAHNIPDFLIQQGWDAISFNKAIGALAGFSFITTKNQSSSLLQQYRVYDLHRLVRLAIRNWLKMNNMLNQRTAQMLKTLALKSRESGSHQYDTSFFMLPHAIELLASDLLQCRSSSSQPLEVNNVDKPSLVDLYSTSTTISTEFRETIHLLENVDTIVRLMAHAAVLLSYVALRFRDAQSYEKARNFAAKSLGMSTLVYGESHRSTLFCVSSLANTLERMDKYEQAEQLLRQKVTICESDHGSLHTLTLDALLELRDLLADKERKREAKEIGDTAIQRCQESLLVLEGEEYLDVLLILANFQYGNDNFEEAEKSTLFALQGYEAANNDLEVITALDHLSKIYMEQGRLGLAVDTRKAEVDHCIRICGLNSPRTMYARQRLIRSLLKDNQLEEARRQVSLALELIGQVYDVSSDTYEYYLQYFDKLFSDHGRVLFPQ